MLRALAATAGAYCVRVHDVRAGLDAVRVAAAWKEGQAMPSRLVCRALDWELSTADVLRLVRADPHPVALTGTWPAAATSWPPTRCACAVRPARWRTCWMTRCRAPRGCRAGMSAGFGGGWIGYLGFGLAEQLLPVPPAPGEPRQLPAYWFGYYDHVLRRDRATGRWVFEALGTPGRGDALQCRFGELSRRARAAGPAAPVSCGSFRLTPSADEHRSAVRQAISYICRGDIFQANICLRLEAAFTGDPLDAFCHAVTRLDPPYAAFMRTPDGAVASLSPELFLRRSGTSVQSQPIKGTRSRPAGELPARRERELLERSAKDRAENVMIVDLMRNDLSRVCVPGSVQVPALLRAEAHPGVWHLVLRRPRHAAGRDGGRAADRRRVPARLGHRRAEGPGPGDHPRARGDPPRGLHRSDRLPEPRRPAWN